MADNTPQSREEALLQNILGAQNEIGIPKSRIEKIWQYALGIDGVELEPAKSRIEVLAIQVAELVRNGGGTTPTGTISITENGTVDVAQYASADVAVHDVEDALVEGQLCGFYTNDRVTTVGVHALYGYWRTQDDNNGLSLPNVKTVQGSGVYGGTYLETAYLPIVERLDASSFRSCTNLVAFIMSDITAPPSVLNSNAFQDTAIAAGTGYIYVPDDLVDECKAASNLSAYAAQIKGMSDCPQEYKTLYGIN